jgi:hypothetical protein
VCAHLAIRRSLHTHETIGRSVWDWLHNGDVHEDLPISSLFSLFASQFLSFTGAAFVAVLGIRSRDFGAPSFLGEVSAKRKMWGVPGPNSKTLIILQNSD